MKELAAIEENLDLDTDRKHFKRRKQRFVNILMTWDSVTSQLDLWMG